MADDPNAAAPASPVDPASLAQYVQMLMGQGQGAAQPPPAPVDRSTASLLGEALGGGTTGLSPADREAAGTRALLNFGANLSAASGYSTMPRTFGQVFAQGVSGAEQSLGGSEEVSAARLAAQQQYAEKEQELHLEAIKTALPLLQYQYQAQLAAKAGQIAGGGGSGASIAAPGTFEGSIAASEGTTPSTTSTSAGVGGFTEGTWGDYVKANPSVFAGMTPEQILAARNNPAIATPAITWLAQQNAPVLAKAGVQPSGPSLTVAHKLGPTAAAAVMQAPPNTPLVDVLTASIGKDEAAAYLKANPSFAGQTAGSYRSQFANVPDPGFLKPATAPVAPAPYKAASAGATVPAPSASAPGAAGAAAASAIPVAPAPQPQATTTQPTATTPPPPTAPPENPDITVGGVTTKYPGDRGDYIAQHRLPTPTIGEYDPNLDPGTQASFDTKAKGIALQKALIPTIGDPVAQQKATADLAAQSTALDAEQSSAAAAKRATANAAINKFNEGQNTDVGKAYDAAVANYRDVAKTKITSSQDIVKSQATDQISRNNKMMEPYATSAAQAAGLLPSVALAMQILPQLPKNAAPWLEDPANRAKLLALKNFLPDSWEKATDGAALYSQVMSNLVGQMAGNVVSGQTGGREAAYQQFKMEYPGLADTAEGRERGLLYVQELLQRRMQVDEEMQKYQANAPRDPVTGIPDMSAARSAVENKVPMLQLPPTSYRPDLPPTSPKEPANVAAYAKYYNNINLGGRYIGYVRDDQGAMHPVARTKVPLTDQNGKPVLDANGKPVAAPP